MGELLNKQVNISVSERTRRTLDAIAAKHNMPATDVGRGLLDAACVFFEQHGFFSFPVRIEPEAFQRAYIAAEDKGLYQTGPGKGGASPPGKPPDNSKRHRGDGPRRAVS